MDAAILVEYLASPVKVAAIRAYGARVISLRFRSSAEIFSTLEAIAGKAPYSFVNFINPVRHEAMKTYAYEICEALDWRASRRRRCTRSALAAACTEHGRVSVSCGSLAGQTALRAWSAFSLWRARQS